MELKDGESFSLNSEGVKNVQKDEGKVEVVFDREIVSASELMKNILEKYEVLDFELKEPDIGTVVKKVYNEGLEE